MPNIYRTARFMMTQSDLYQFRIEKVARWNEIHSRDNFDDDEDDDIYNKINTEKIYEHWDTHQKQIFGNMKKRRKQRRKVLISHACVHTH